MNLISIANDFTKFPGGRFPEDGEFSGQEFRENFLIPAYLSGLATTIDFDGTRGYGSSFLEEAFGGIIRQLKISSEDFFKIFTLKSSRPSLIEEVTLYINNAAQKCQH